MESLDRYDVEAMIRDALRDFARSRDLDSLEQDLRRDLEQTHRYLQGEIDSIERVLHSRTDSLV